MTTTTDDGGVVGMRVEIELFTPYQGWYSYKTATVDEVDGDKVVAHQAASYGSGRFTMTYALDTGVDVLRGRSRISPASLAAVREAIGGDNKCLRFMLYATSATRGFWLRR